MSEIKRIQASISLKKLGEAVRAGHPAVTTSKAGDKYASVTLWVNDTPDSYGNNVSLQLTQQKDATDKATYIGNGKTDAQLRAMSEAKQGTAPAAYISEPNDLPF